MQRKFEAKEAFRNEKLAAAAFLSFFGGHGLV